MIYIIYATSHAHTQGSYYYVYDLHRSEIVNDSN